MKRSAPMRRTPMKRTPTPTPRTGLARKPAKRRPTRSPNDFPEESRMAMRLRSGGRCEVQSKVCTGDAQVFHHRLSRRHRDQRPVNGLHACDACHVHLHANPTKARVMGWLVPSWLDPAEVPVKRGSPV